MICLDHAQNLHIHAVRAKILWSIFEPEGRCTNRTSEVRLVHLLIDRLIWLVWDYGACADWLSIDLLVPYIRF